MHIRHILFDLDGTLLPMNQDEFVTFYMPLLAKKYISEGISFDPKAFIASVWKLLSGRADDSVFHPVSGDKPLLHSSHTKHPSTVPQS